MVWPNRYSTVLIHELLEEHTTTGVDVFILSQNNILILVLTIIPRLVRNDVDVPIRRVTAFAQSVRDTSVFSFLPRLSALGQSNFIH